MLPFVLGGVALATTGYGIKKFLDNETNHDKIDQALTKGIEWLDSVDQKAEIFFDGLIQKIYESKNQEKLELLLDQLDSIKQTTAIIIYHDIEELLFHATKSSCSTTYQACEIAPLKNSKQHLLLYTEETYRCIQRFCIILTSANDYLSHYIQNVKDSEFHNTPYILSQKQIKTFYKLQTFLENTVYCPISINNVTISNISKRSFNKIKHTIELFKN